ncbi:Gustatory receptor 19 [Halyomorpha halys]|nr:Gustatory receptor 19 [Halyomorpha halys]
MTKSVDIYWEAFPVFSVSKIVGVAPYTDSFVLSVQHLAYSCLFLLVSLADACYLTFKLESNSDFSLILDRLQLFILELSLVVSIIKAVTNVTTIRWVMNKLETLDTNLARIGVHVQHQRLDMFSVMLTRVFLVFTLFLCDLWEINVYRTWRSILHAYAMLVTVLLGNIVQVQFIVLLNLVQRRMRLLIVKLNQFALSDGFIKTNKFQTLLSTHSSLVTVCENVNGLYSLQILIILSSIFILSTSYLYSVILKTIELITLRSFSGMDIFLMICYRIVVRAYEVWTMVTSCAGMQEQAAEFNTLLYQLMIDDKTNDISNNKKLRLHISMKREVVFTACGFFPLDYTLVHSMIAAATTYLVILIQFGDQSNSNPKAASSNSTEASTLLPITMEPS